jgi:hypothetical protein
MQQQQTIPSAPVHVKVALDNEFRRFLLSPTTFDNLYTKLKTLFNLQTDFRIKFQDDENDWVLIMTDQELVYATELSGSPLRLQVKTVDAEPNPLPTTQCGRGKFGRGCRGGRGGKGGKAREERLLQKSSRLTERIGQLEAKLQSNNKLTSERERILRWKITRLQEKLAWVQSVHASLQTAENSEQQPAVVPDNTAELPGTPLPTEESTKSSPPMRGGHRGGCRGGWRRAMMEEGADHPCCRKGRKGRIDPELIANFRQCKANLQAARESGNAEQINSCLEAFRAAKIAKWEARAALRTQEASTDDEQKA